ncbi:hypothetical protein SAMN05428997_12935 [Bosea sp. CRIB-10]|uniref:hypothetical protein n=1 Tax=unclassified Bosea (in: a-proteobacteria) TaxID=2653178 RepID=UPI0008E884E7|nr:MULTISPECIES: hypothetical protein [unclassified Bosea (in: a-proteobacteria)]MBR3193731.1 hypothetical protein [Bosea sp. (in: a-proteobacteria)]SFD46554.1 hypothetical protein SAMN05428997_12935 [Bosea sp. CRIB-10]
MSITTPRHPRLNRSMARAGLALCLLCPTAAAQSAVLRLNGAGGLSCHVLDSPAKARLPEGRAALQWSFGYLTGRVQSGAGEPHQRFAGPDGIAAAIIAYCRAHPKRQVADAAADFFGP